MTSKTNGTECVLLIDDNRADAVLIKNSLNTQSREAEFELVWVDRLSKGVEFMGKKKIAAVVLNVMLPDSVGLGAVQQVRRADPDIPILILSAVYDERLAAAGLRAGAEEFLVKDDVDERSIVRALRSAIARSCGRVEMVECAVGIRELRQCWEEARLPLASVEKLVRRVVHGLAGRVNTQQYEYLSNALENLDAVSEVIEQLDSMSRAAGGNGSLHHVAAVPAVIPMAAASADAANDLGLSATQDL